jgi:hypothetical protein
MTKLKGSSIARLEDEAALDEYYKEAALDALLYWTNSTSQMAGSNATMSLLTEMLGTCVANMVPVDQVDRAKKTIFGLLNEAFSLVDKNSSQVSPESSDKGNMN